MVPSGPSSRGVSRLGRTAALVLALTLAACGGRPDGVMAPATLSAEGTSKVDMLVVSTRSATGDPARPFDGERGRQASMNEVAVSIPPEKVREALEPGGLMRGDPIAARRPGRSGSDDAAVEGAPIAP